MSYLQILQQRLREPSRFEAALGDITESLGQYNIRQQQEAERQRLLKQQEDERQRQLAQQQVQFIQERVPKLRAVEQFEQMAKLLPVYRSAVKGAYGIDIPGGDVVGAPVYGKPAEQPRPAPSFIGPMPLGPAPELRREFGGAMTRKALDERFMLPPEQPEYKAVGGALFDPKTKEFLVPPTQLTAADKMTAQRERNFTNLKRQEIGARGALQRAGLMASAGIEKANIAATAGLTAAQLRAEQQELNRIQNASQFADTLDARQNMFNQALGLRKDAATQKVNTEIAKAAPGAFRNVTNQLDSQKLQAAITTVTDESGLPNYVMGLDSPDAVKKAAAAARANGFAVAASADDPNTIVLMPQRGMQKEIPLVVTGAGTYGPKVVNQAAAAPTTYTQNPDGTLTAVKAVPGTRITPPARAATAATPAGGGRPPNPLSPNQKIDQAHIEAERLYYKWADGMPNPALEKKKLAMLGAQAGGRERKKTIEQYNKFFQEALSRLDKPPNLEVTTPPAPAKPAAPKKSVQDIYLGN
jgi:hypothetical protein